jgi:hypothetical protein
VDVPDKNNGKRRLCVHIEYDLVGFIPLDELMKQRRHDKYHAVAAKSI